MVIDWPWYFLQLLLFSEVVLLTVSHANSVELIVLWSSLGIEPVFMGFVLMWDLEMKLREVIWNVESLVLHLRVVEVLVRTICLWRVRSSWRRGITHKVHIPFWEPGKLSLVLQGIRWKALLIGLKLPFACQLRQIVVSSACQIQESAHSFK